ncbi:MAG: hypothetical protein NZM44_05990 [Candidatus Calescibacterium sp.]|nr:hypothetical protein [Candidatus Calescibacterium sp.]
MNKHIIAIEYEGFVRLFDVYEDSVKSGINLDLVQFGELDVPAVVFGYTGKRHGYKIYKSFILCCKEIRVNDELEYAKIFVNKKGYNMLKKVENFKKSEPHPAIVKVYKSVKILNNEKSFIFAEGFDGDFYEYGLWLMPQTKFTDGKYVYLYDGYTINIVEVNHES